MTDRYTNMINDGCPERIWIESDRWRPYFYPEGELADVAPTITEYVRADKLRAEIEALRAEVEVWKATFHSAASGHAVYSERTEQLEALVRELEGREQRDEALLRQALDVLSRAYQTAMWQAIKARVPECGEFLGIAQDLDFVVAALRERLGEGEQQ